MKNIITLLLFIISILLITYSLFNKQQLAQSKPEQFKEVQEEVLNKLNTNQELVIEDIKIGEGEEVNIGDTITVHYEGKLEDNTVFDSSYENGEPVELTLEPGGLIQGWIQGIPGMKEGGKRKLIIPPNLGYGSQDLGTIPPNSTLIFEVEMLEVKAPEEVEEEESTTTQEKSAETPIE